MNKTQVIALADFIESGMQKIGIKFQMDDWIHLDKGLEIGEDDKPKSWCGTSACVAGTEVLRTRPDLWRSYLKQFSSTGYDGPQPTHVSVVDTAQESLGLTNKEVNDLFIPSSWRYSGLPEEIEHEDITEQDAVKVLRHFAETGKVDWSIADWSERVENKQVNWTYED